MRAKFQSSSLIVLAVAVFGVACSLRAAVAADETTRAVWKPIDTTFDYSGFTTYYSCEGLSDRIRDVLRQVGARKLKVYGLGCATPNGGPSALPSVRIMGEIPVEATPDNLAAVAKIKEERAKNSRAAKETLGPEEFTAIRRIVKLSTRHNVGVEVGDCELLEQIRGRLLPDLGVKVVDDNVRCTPHQANIAAQTLDIETLAPVNKAVAEAKE